MRRIHRESLIAAFALDLESLVVRMVCKKFFDIGLSILTDTVKITFELSGKAYGYYTEDLRSLMEVNGITDVLILYNVNTFVEDRSLGMVLE